MANEPYRDTSVSVDRSKAEVRDALRTAGARALQMEEEWDENGHVTSCVVRFSWPTDAGSMIRLRLAAVPLPPEAGARGGWKVDRAQRERQAWRGLAWYISSLVKAATFGLIPFEAVFLAYIEDPATGKTIGDQLLPQIETGRLALTAGA